MSAKVYVAAADVGNNQSFVPSISSQQIHYNYNYTCKQLVLPAQRILQVAAIELQILCALGIL